MGRTKHVAHKKKPTSRPKAPGPSSPTPGTSQTTRRSPRTTPVPRAQTGQRKRRRNRPGTNALREIRHFQKTSNLLIPAAPFIRATDSDESVSKVLHVKEVTNYFSPTVNRWTAEALVAIQEAAEAYLVSLFEDATLCTIHARRVTLMRRDFELARRIGGKKQRW